MTQQFLVYRRKEDSGISSECEKQDSDSELKRSALFLITQRSTASFSASRNHFTETVRICFSVLTLELGYIFFTLRSYHISYQPGR